ncbi:MAG TPA: AMMECR1 domain-containing protein [Chroococcales cyanobacterium]
MRLTSVLLFIALMTPPSVNATILKNEKCPPLKEIARNTLAMHYGHLVIDPDSGKPFQSIQQYANSLPVPERYKKARGIFVTFSKHGKTRACWGSIYPEYPDLVKGTVYATEAALERDYRFGKIKAKELNSLKPQVTVVHSVTPISSLSGQDPLQFGLLVKSGGKGAVILPGEARDSFYQLVQCKLKAGIPSAQHCQMYRIKADVYN